MFTITIVFGNVSCPLMFRDRDKATSIWNAVSKRRTLDSFPPQSTSEMLLIDEFGREIFLPAGMLYGAILEDLIVSKEGAIETSLHQARTNAALQARAQSDPALRAAQHGPSVLTPMGAGNGRFS